MWDIHSHTLQLQQLWLDVNFNFDKYHHSIWDKIE